MQYTKNIFATISIISLFTLPMIASSNDLWNKQEGKNQIGQAFGIKTGQNPKDVRLLIVDIIKVCLSILGILFVIMIIWAGYKYMTSQGKEEKIQESLGQIKTAIVGLIIIFMAWSLTIFISNKIIEKMLEQKKMLEQNSS